MSRATVSIVAFGVYLISIAGILLVAPNLLLGLVGITATHEVWIRVAGFLAGAMGYYYLQAARLEVRAFYRWTVHARLLVPVVFTAFVLSGLVQPMLLIFAAIDLAAAIWTGLALRLDERAS